MSASTALLVIMYIWLAIGLTAALVMGRKGHDPGTWGVIGAVLGPLVVPVAWISLRRDATSGVAETLALGRSRGGPVNILVGIDGSTDAGAAEHAAVDLLGNRLGRVVLATVVDPEDAQTIRGESDGTVDARRALAAASTTTALQPDTLILTGRPADALVRYAVDHDIDLIVVGARGRGLRTRLLGSVAEGVARQRSVPVLIAGDSRGADA